MAEYADTTIVFEGNTKSLRKLLSLIEAWTNPIDDNRNSRWLGNVAIGLSMHRLIDEDKCNGWISFLDDSSVLSDTEIPNDTFSMDTQTAWQPEMDLWDRLIEKYVPDIKVYWYSYEPYGGIYCTNDRKKRHFDGDFVVEVQGDKDYGFYDGELITADNLHANLTAYLGDMPLDEQIKEAKERFHLIIHPIEYV